MLIVAAFLLDLVNSNLWACATCGQASTYTPKMLLIGLGFFILPVSIIALIGWKVWKDQKILDQQDTHS